MGKIRIVVEMNGGVVQAIHTDSGHSCDVVITENAKYGSDDFETAVETGPFKGQIIYQQERSIAASKEVLDPVFAAARCRQKAT